MSSMVGEGEKKTGEKKGEDLYKNKGRLVPVPECRELFPETINPEAEPVEGLEPSEANVSPKTLTRLLLAYGRERGLTEGEVIKIIKANAGGNYAKALDFYAALKGKNPGCGYADGECPMRRSY